MLEKLNQPYILLFVSMFLCAVGRAMSNLYSKRYAANRADGVFYTFVIGIVAVPVIDLLQKIAVEYADRKRLILRTAVDRFLHLVEVL